MKDKIQNTKACPELVEGTKKETEYGSIGVLEKQERFKLRNSMENGKRENGGFKDKEFRN